jgi:hypothetical protein
MKTLQQEIDALNAKRLAIKTANTVASDFPAMTRERTYRKSISIRTL